MTDRTETAVRRQKAHEGQRRPAVPPSAVEGTRPSSEAVVEAGTLDTILSRIDELSRRLAALEGAAPLAEAGEQVAKDEISPQEAAGLLRMSRPSVMRLIGRGLLHPRKVLSRHKLSRAEVLAYRDEQGRQQRQALENLTAFAEEHDF